MTGSWSGRTGPVTVRVPATSANLGPGFDALGVALDLADEVTAEVAGSGWTVEVSGEGAAEVPTTEEHLVVKTILATLRHVDHQPPAGVRLTCVNRIPHARGLGSSSAAIVAGILLGRALAGLPDDREWALHLAAELEGHPDNVAPCLYGGFTIAWSAPAGARAVSLTPTSAVRPLVFVPDLRGLTAHARAALPPQVPHVDAAFNLARSALLVHALTRAPELLLTATEDRLHQPYRAASMPATAALVASLRADGIPAVVSGAGPSVLALVAADASVPAPAGWLAHPLAWSSQGARLRLRHAGADPVAGGRVG